MAAAAGQEIRAAAAVVAGPAARGTVEATGREIKASAAAVAGLAGIRIEAAAAFTVEEASGRAGAAEASGRVEAAAGASEEDINPYFKL